jgi:hypothetical protein
VQSVSDWKYSENSGNVGVTDKGFIRFAAEKAGGRERNLAAANVMKPGSELDLGGKIDL